VKPFNIPPSPSVPFLDGIPNPVSVAWYLFFRNIFQSVGDGTAPLTLNDLAGLFIDQRLALAVPSWLQVQGSPVGGNTGIVGKFTITSANIAQNLVLASPNGAQGALLPRRLVGADIPTPTATTLGGVKALAPVTHFFLTGLDITGILQDAQPAFTDIAGAITGIQSAPGVATNSSAHAGYPGEFISSTVVSPVSLTTATPLTVTSISLTAGDWDVSGSIYFAPAGTTIISDEQGGIDLTTNTLPTAPAGGYANVSGLAQAAGTAISLTLGYVRVSLASTTTVYLVAQATFTVSTCGAYGTIQARRSANVY
jgi:hypothetical protein